MLTGIFNCYIGVLFYFFVTNCWSSAHRLLCHSRQRSEL